MNRDGHVDEDSGSRIPKFGGGDAAWGATVACVKSRYAAFRVNVVDARPATGNYITAVVGGKASMLGGDDSTTNGVGPYTGSVIEGATVFVFSQVGTGERDIENLCAVTAHEVAHALGLDHTYYCGDVMSYFVDKCGARTFRDVDASCGEYAKRTCANGDASQNSYRRLAALVGLRSEPVVLPPSPDPVITDPADSDSEDSDSDSTDSDDSADSDSAAASDPSPASPYADADDDADDADDDVAPAQVAPHPDPMPASPYDDDDVAPTQPVHKPACGARAPATDATTVEQHTRWVHRGHGTYRVTTVTMHRHWHRR